MSAISDDRPTDGPDPVEPEPKLLSMPPVERVHFARNFIKQAVCEFRFPTIFELEGPRPPLPLAQALRKEYPIHEISDVVNVRAASVAKGHSHVFKAHKARWSVTLRAASISLETANYDSFEEFEARTQFVLNAAKQTIDSDFFTRIGLRYINVVPSNIVDVDQWVNPALVGPLAAGLFGDVSEHSGRISGNTDCGGYLLQHGIALESPKREYVLDFDFHAEDVEFSDAMATLRQLHNGEHAMFRWALGPKAFEFLNRPIEAKGKKNV